MEATGSFKSDVLLFTFDSKSFIDDDIVVRVSAILCCIEGVEIFDPKSDPLPVNDDNISLIDDDNEVGELTVCCCIVDVGILELVNELVYFDSISFIDEVVLLKSGTDVLPLNFDNKSLIDEVVVGIEVC